MRNLICIGAMAVLVSACVTEQEPYPRVDPTTGIPILEPPILNAETKVWGKKSSGLKVGPALSSVENCEEVEVIFRAHALAEIGEILQRNFESAWNEHDHCDDDFWWGGCGMDASCAADAGAATPITNPDDPEHSETNNQVVGVDEADFVKTDGNFIYILSGGKFRILKSWPAAETKQLSEVVVEGEPKKLFVHNNRALIYSSLDMLDSYGYGYWYGYGYSDDECTYGYDCVPTGDGRATQIMILDITDRTAPKYVRKLEVSSSLLSARRIGNAIHTVLTRQVKPYWDLQTYSDHLNICSSTKYDIYRAYKQLLDANVSKILNTPIHDSFPTVTDKVFNGQSWDKTSPMLECTDFYKASISDGQSFSSVLSISINNTKPFSAVTIVSKPGVVYASEDALYLAVPRVRTDEWGWYEGLDEYSEATTIHKFLLGNEPAVSKYIASGLVKGRILNQFALDEYEDHLRIASTNRTNWPTSNALTVLKQQESSLVPTGVLDGLAPTEDIRSVRFDGEKGYVVTFKKTDPLFVLDLKDPIAPKVLGELKIPGFSTYMHKMDEKHLLTIGYDGDDQGSFAWFQGVALQIFDVAEPTNPKLKFKHVIGTRGSSSEALTNHLAFTYYAPKDLLAIPMTICEGSAGGGNYGEKMTFSGLLVFDVTKEKGFSLRGGVSHPVSEYVSCYNWWTNVSSQVKRSIIIDNFVYSISESLLKVNDLDKIETDIVSLPLM
ncbi:MAG: beta-propeller domain-containing protein [Pseudomonadota bacterium]